MSESLGHHLALTVLCGPVVPSFRALSGRFKFMVQRHKFNEDSLLYVYRIRSTVARRAAACGSNAETDLIYEGSSRKLTTHNDLH